MSKVWMTIMQDNEGNLMALDKNGDVIVKAPRTRPAHSDGRADKFSEELVGDVPRLARLAMVLITRKDHEESRF
jgi:hypothetical protein